MKKLVTFLCAVVAVLATVAIAGCNVSGGAAAVGGDVNVNMSVVFTANGDVMELGESASVKDYMDALKQQGQITFEGSNGDYGFFIESVYGVKAEGNAFWAVYTDLVTLEGDDAVYSTAEWGTFTYGGKTLNSANYGVSSLPCVEGYTYAIVYSTY